MQLLTDSARQRRVGSRNRRAWPALAVALAVGLAGCNSLLDVNNPNNVSGDELRNPVAQRAVVNGALSTVARGVANVILGYSAATDELVWVGSRDGFNQLDRGFLNDPFNEFTDDQFRFLAEGRWMAREAVTILEEHRANGDLLDPNDLARAYLHAAIAYTTIADMYDDYAFSDRRESGPPFGPANMGGVYDSAIAFVSEGLDLATNATLRRNLFAMRARAQHGKGVWGLVQPPISSTELVNNAAAVTDAQAALGLDDSDWRYVLSYSTATVTNTLGVWVNSRQELRLGDPYIYPNTSNTRSDSLRLVDPIDGVEAPGAAWMFAATNPPVPNGANPHVVTSAREMHLIIAEAALAAGNTGGFASAMNDLRDYDELTSWDETTPQLPAQELLEFERMSSLFLQGRRLADMYRFRITDPRWDPASPAITAPGTFLPITVIECRANEHIADACQAS